MSRIEEKSCITCGDQVSEPKQPFCDKCEEAGKESDFWAVVQGKELPADEHETHIGAAT